MWQRKSRSPSVSASASGLSLLSFAAIVLLAGCTTVSTPNLVVRSVAQNVVVNSATPSGEWTVVQISPSALDDTFELQMMDDSGVILETRKESGEGRKTSMWSNIVSGLFGFLGGLLVGG